MSRDTVLPVPEDLVGVAEVAELLSVSRQRVSQLAATPGFPDPVARLAAGPIWERDDIIGWAEVTGRKIVADDAGASATIEDEDEGSL
jgi:hypothetical protein